MRLYVVRPFIINVIDVWWCTVLYLCVLDADPRTDTKSTRDSKNGVQHRDVSGERPAGAEDMGIQPEVGEQLQESTFDPQVPPGTTETGRTVAATLCYTFHNIFRTLTV
jgi:hypothetical protein